MDFVLFLELNPMHGIIKCHLQSQVLFKTVQETKMDVTLTVAYYPDCENFSLLLFINLYFRSCFSSELLTKSQTFQFLILER